MRRFKLLKGFVKPNYAWAASGLLDDAENPEMLCGVLDVTLEYIHQQNLTEDLLSSLLFPIMTRIYRTKNNTYPDYQIKLKLLRIEMWLRSDELRNIMVDIRNGAFMSIDAEAEMCLLTAERFDWVEV
jgi:hypothetical protein